MILEFAVAAFFSCDPRLATLFAPLRPALGHYEVCTTGAPLDAAVASEVAAGAHASPAELVDPVAAFGAVGLYDRTALVQLYAGRRVRTVRAWRESAGRFESMTFISPYPNSAFTKLVDGTLARVFVLERGRAPGDGR